MRRKAQFRKRGPAFASDESTKGGEASFVSISFTSCNSWLLRETSNWLVCDKAKLSTDWKFPMVANRALRVRDFRAFSIASSSDSFAFCSAQRQWLVPWLLCLLLCASMFLSCDCCIAIHLCLAFRDLFIFSCRFFVPGCFLGQLFLMDSSNLGLRFILFSSTLRFRGLFC